ncbi:MAG: hydrogenase [Deltaproteobacteria bacterium]|nr:hydrogenase [Deltaproteobacteria bacterium]
MNSLFLPLQNAVPFPLSKVPVLAVEEWRTVVLNGCGKERGRVAALFADAKRLYAMLAFDAKKNLKIGACELPEGGYPSLTPELPEVHLFEREIFEETGLKPAGHPGLKPVRSHQKKYPFHRIEGTHEVAVGPVHAGIIEPGHFRFQCHGEKVLHLEILLGYQHRGLEALFLKSDAEHRSVLAESVAGDTVIGHALAYCHAIEGLAERSILPKRCQMLRGIVLELERASNHAGDLGALAGDIGFLPASAWFGRLRGEFLNMLMELTGNRYGRGFIRPGAVTHDIPSAMTRDFIHRTGRALKEFKELSSLFFEASSVLARLEGTGTLKQETAKSLGVVGPAARASNSAKDVRQDHPSGIFSSKGIAPVKVSSGDVFARARVRSLEAKRSLEWIGESLETLTAEKISQSIGETKKEMGVVSLVEGWRGEIAHIAMTDQEGKIARYKIIDPSFHNWPALAAAMKGGAVSDFPLVNKSFNLSYAGHDL